MTGRKEMVVGRKGNDRRGIEMTGRMEMEV